MRSVRRFQRGSVIIHVLVTGMIIAFIVSSLMGLMIMQFGLTIRAQDTNERTRADEGALSRLFSNWAENKVKPYCQNFANYSCSGAGVAGGGCNCECSATGLPTITATPDTGDSSYCKIAVKSQN